MNKLVIAVISGLGIGAGLMYIFDPSKGKQRRSLARNKVAHLLTTTGDKIETASHHITHKTKGMLAEASHLFKSKEVIDDVLIARVRSKIGHVISHPHSIEVSTKDGRITLKGSVPANEFDSLIKTALSVRGVIEVIDELVQIETAPEPKPLSLAHLARG